MSWILGRAEDYSPTPEELYDELVEKIKARIKEEKKYVGECEAYAAEVLEDLLK